MKNKPPYKKGKKPLKIKETSQAKPELKSNKGFDIGGSFRIQALFLFIIAIGLYANTLVCKYTLDDMLMITENKFTKKGIDGIKDIMTNDALVGFFGKDKNLLPGGRYRPLSQVFFAIEYEFFGLNPFIGHLLNVLLYALTGVFIFYLLRKFFKLYDKTIWYLSLPFVITALFIAHPLHTEVVANIKGRDEIMSLLGSVATLFFVLKYMETKKLMNLVWSSVAFLFALLSKENAITFLAVVPLTLLVFTNSSMKNYVTALSPLVLITIVYLIIRYNALGFLMNDAVEKELLNNPFVNSTASEKFATIFYTWGKYIELLFIPHPLTHDYYPKQIPLINWADLRAIIPLLIYIALITYALINVWKKNIIAYGILFYMITFSIQSNIVFNIGTFMNERFMFMSLLAFCIIIAYFLTDKLKMVIKSKKTYQQVATFILIIMMLAYSIKTISRNPVWKDDFTLFTTDVKTSTNSAKCNVSAGGMLVEKAQKDSIGVNKNEMLQQAITYLKRGAELHPRYPAVWILLGNAYLELKDYELSRYYYENCLKISHSHSDALNNMLCVAQRTNKEGKYVESVKCYKTLIKYQPKKYSYYESLSEVYENMKRIDTCIIILNNIIEVKPDYYQAYNRLGKIYGQYYNNLDKSLEYLLKAYEIKPDFFSVLENLGVAYGIKRDYNKSLFYFKKASEVEPKNSRLYINMAGTYKNMGRSSEYNECLKKAQEIEISNKNKKNNK